MKQLRHDYVDGCLRRENSIEKLKAFMDLGVNMNTKLKGSYGRNALGSSATGSLFILRYLIEVCGCRIDITSELAYTVLHEASGHGASLANVRYLVERGAAINQRDMLGDTPLHRAASAANTTVCEYLISKGADVHILNKAKWNPLHCVCLHTASIETLRVLLGAGAIKDINGSDKFGRPPITFIRNSAELLEYMFRSGADPNFSLNGVKPAFVQALCSYDGVSLGVIKVYLDAGMDPNITDQRSGISAMHFVLLQTKLDQIDGVREFLTRGADPSIPAKTKSVVKFLMSRGLPISAIPKKQTKLTMLHTILLNPNPEMLELVLANPLVQKMLQKPDPTSGLGWIEFVTQVNGRQDAIDALNRLGAV